MTKAALRNHLDNLALAPGVVHYYPSAKPSVWRSFRALERARYLVLTGSYSFPHFRLIGVSQ